MKIKSPLYIITVVLFIQYIVVTAFMMFFYNAGNRYAPELKYFVLDQNYLSDLGRTIGFSGSENPSYIFYSLTLSFVGIGILLFFLQIQNSISNKAKYVIIISATVSAVGYIGIAYYPVDVNLKSHITFGRLAFLSFFIATFLSQLLLDKKKYTVANKLFWILNIMLFGYLLLMFFGPSSTRGIWALQLKTISQKIMVYSQIILCIFILQNIKEKSK